MLTSRLLSQRPPLQDEGVIDLQIDRWDRAVAAHRAWQEIGKLCTDFIEGKQWSDADKAKLEAEGRAPITLNKINPLRRLLVGYFRQNGYDIRYLPGAYGNDESARAITHTSKQISEKNQTAWNEADVFNDGLTTGRGYFDVRIDFTDNIFGEIKETVLDPFSVYPDPEGSAYDPETWNFVQISRWLSWEDVQSTFGLGAAEMVDTMGQASSRLGMPQAGSGGEEIHPDRWFALNGYMTSESNNFAYLGNRINGPYDWIDRKRKMIRVVECQHRVTDSWIHFVDPKTGGRQVVPEGWSRERIQRAIEYWAFQGVELQIIKGPRKRIRHTFSAADIVLFDDWLLDKTFTVIPYFPYFRRGKTRGFAEDLLDPQREINKRRSSFLHIVTTMANSGWHVEEGAMTEESEQQLEEEGSRPGIILKHKQGRNKPERIQPALPPTAVEHAEKFATNDIKEISGINDSAMGNLDRVQSGRAIISRQRQAIVGAEEYFHNFARTRWLNARKRLELVQLYYTEERLIRVRGEDATAQPVDMFINQQTPEGRLVNNVAVGDYSIAIDEAPASSTFEDAEFDDMVTMVKDLGVPIPPDIIVDASNVGRKREIVDRLRMAQGLPGTDGEMPGAPGTPPGAPGAPPVAGPGGPPVPLPAPNGVPMQPGTPQVPLRR